MKIKRVLALLLICALTFTLSVPASASGTDKRNGFIDVTSGKRCCDAVRYCAEHGLMSGITDKLFMPDALLTRAQLASVLYCISGTPDTCGMNEPFSDILNSRRTRNAIVWAYNSGLMQGISTHFFCPDGTVSRGQLVSTLYLYAGSPSVSESINYKDAGRIPSAYRKAVSWAYINGIITDLCDRYFNSALPVTRAQMAVITEKFYKVLPALQPQEQTDGLKIVSFNIRHCSNVITDKIDYDAFADFLKSLDADIIALNEVRGKCILPGYDAQAAILAEKLGYYYYFAKAIDVGNIVSYGNAVLTRLKIKKCETIRIPAPALSNRDSDYEPRSLLKLTVADPELTVLVSHFGLSDAEKANAVKTVMDNIPDGKCVLMGDLNVTPDKDTLDPIRTRLVDIASSSPQELLTFRSKDPHCRIDYIFASPDISVDSVSVSPSYPLSDHMPLVAQIRLGGNGQ